MGFLKSAFMVLLVSVALKFIPSFFQSPLKPSMDGYTAPAFRRVAHVFRENLESGLETGAGFAVFHNGEMVVNLVGGYADEEAKVPWEKDTLTNLFSVTKGLGAISVAMLVDRGLLDYRKPVWHYWPEFAENGKQHILVKHLVSHQAGLETIDEEIKLKWTITDPSKLNAIIAQQKPRVKPGEGKFGYHSITYGLYVNELLRRVDPMHRTMQQFIKEELADAIGLDVHLGLPKEESYRTARLKSYSSNFLTMVKYYAAVLSDPIIWNFFKSAFKKDTMFAKVLANPTDFPRSTETMNSHTFRELPFTSSNAFATATSLAQLYGALAEGGTVRSKKTKLMSPKTVKQLYTPLVSGIEDTMGFNMTIAHGTFMRENPMGEVIFGSMGSGGQMAYADPGNGLGWAYVTNHVSMKPDNMNARYVTLYNAMYEALKDIKK